MLVLWWYFPSPWSDRSFVACSLEPVQVLNYTGMDHGSVLGNPGILNTFMGILQNYSTPIQSSVVRG